MRPLGALASRSAWLGSRCGVLDGRVGCGAGARRMVGDELGRDELGGDELGGVASGREVGGLLGRVDGVPALGGGLDGREGVADGRLGAGVLGREGGLTLGREEPPPWGAEGRELPPDEPPEEPPDGRDEPPLEPPPLEPPLGRPPPPLLPGRCANAGRSQTRAAVRRNESRWIGWRSFMSGSLRGSDPGAGQH